MKIWVACLCLAFGILTSTVVAHSDEGDVESYETTDIYVDLRNQAFNYMPANPDAGPDLLVVLMETGYPEAVATLVAVSDGTVSLYFSSGGGIVGDGEHAAVRQVASTLLSAAAPLVSQASRTEVFPLPSRGYVRFYLVTASGINTVEVLEDDLGYRRHSFSPLFHQGHELIAAIWEHAPQ